MADNDRVTIVAPTDTAEQIAEALGQKPAPVAEKPEAKAEEVKTAPEDEEPEPAAAKEAADPAEKDDDADTDDEADVNDSKLPKPSRFQRRIDRLKYDLHRRDEEIERLRAERTVQPPQADPEPEAVPKFTVPRPKEADFDTVEDWTDKLTDWKLEKLQFEQKQERIAEQRRVAVAQQTREQQELRAQHNSRIAEFKKTHADFDAVAREAIASNIALPEIVVVHTMHSEMGPALLYHLATHLDDVEKLNAMSSPGRQLVFLGKLEAKLERENEQASTENADEDAPAKPASKLPSVIAAAGGGSRTRTPPPAPVKPLTGGSNPTTPLDQTDFKEFKRRRAEGATR